MVNGPLIRLYFLGGGIGGVPLDSHDLWTRSTVSLHRSCLRVGSFRSGVLARTATGRSIGFERGVALVENEVRRSEEWTDW